MCESPAKDLKHDVVAHGRQGWVVPTLGELVTDKSVLCIDLDPLVAESQSAKR